MIYSEEVYEMKLEVTVNDDGVIEIVYNDNPTPVSSIAVEFTNVYEGDPDIPVTGDTTNPLLWFAFLLAGVEVLGTTLILGKKTKFAEE